MGVMTASLKALRQYGFRLRAVAVAVSLAAALFTTLSAQETPYKYDIGARLGMSGYIGDANSSNIFKRPGFASDLMFGYLPNARFAIRGMLSTLSLSGSTEGMKDVLPENAVYSFNSQVYELTARGEFNFFAFGIGETYKRLRRWSPYLAIGVGVAIGGSGGKTCVAATLPMAFGVKFKLRERLNLHAEFSMTKAFADHMDSAQLSDLNQIKTAFCKNTDWYSRLSVGISYEFGKRCSTCHYVD